MFAKKVDIESLETRASIIEDKIKALTEGIEDLHFEVVELERTRVYQVEARRRIASTLAKCGFFDLDIVGHPIPNDDYKELKTRFNALCDWIGVEWAQENFEGFRKKEGT